MKRPTLWMLALSMPVLAFTMPGLASPVPGSLMLPRRFGATTPRRPTRLAYPETRREDVTDTYFGQAVPDPYRWLEDFEGAEARDWIEAQNRLTVSVLASYSGREAWKQRLTQMWNFPRTGVPVVAGGRLWVGHNDGLQNQAVIYQAEGATASWKPFLDPNTLSSDGTVALSMLAPSPAGEHVVIGTSMAGSDWQRWTIRDVRTGRDLPETLQGIKFSGVAWTPDGQGFYYSRYEEPAPGQALSAINEMPRLCFHRVGTPQAEDRVVYERPDHPKWGYGAEVTEDGRYLVLSISEGTASRNRVYIQDLTRPGSPIRPLLDAFDARYSVVGSDGSTLYVWTTQAAPRGRLVALDVDRPEPAHWREILSEGTDRLDGVTLLGDRFIVEALRDARHVVRFHDLAGKALGELSLPGIGSVSGFAGRRDAPEVYFSFTGFTTPTTIYRLDCRTWSTSVYREPRLAFDPSRFETSQVFFPSKDGTRIPMFLVHRKGLVLDGQNPTYLYGYGGFNVSLTPSFSVSNLSWVERGGVLAIANLRGGGEYGEEWHQAGTKLHKQNVFDDFIAAAEWLVREHYTAPAHLGIGGGSNGGLLVGACMTQRPDLFGAAVPAVGVLDMLRYHRFTIGWAWASDYGTSDHEDEFRALLAYSPYHRVSPGNAYPPTLVLTGDHDDRVVPLHSFKFAAALQHAQAGSAPVLLRVETRAGHGAGKPTSKLIEEAADRWTFLWHHLAPRGRGREWRQMR